jgi:hypothetical protein
MNEFLFGAAVVAVLSIIATTFLLYHARKQEKEYKMRADKKATQT